MLIEVTTVYDHERIFYDDVTRDEYTDGELNAPFDDVARVEE